MTEQDLHHKLQQAFPQGHITVRDTSGNGYHWHISVVCSSFAQLPLVQRHRKVYGALGTEITTQIHALSLETLTPDTSSPS